MSLTRKISIKELSNILEVHYNTASKDYKVLVDCLNCGRKFLIYQDLITLNILPNNQQKFTNNHK